MPDPLSLLREYNINKKKIIEREGQIIFGEFSWPKNVKTNYKIWRTGKDGVPQDYYTLECLLFLLKNISLSHPVYVRRGAAEKIQVIGRPDRKELLDYLKGETTSCAAIDKSVPLEIPSQVEKSADSDGPETLAKRPRLEETRIEKVNEKLEVKLDGPKEAPVTVDNKSSLELK